MFLDPPKGTSVQTFRPSQQGPSALLFLFALFFLPCLVSLASFRVEENTVSHTGRIPRGVSAAMLL